MRKISKKIEEKMVGGQSWGECLCGSEVVRKGMNFVGVWEVREKDSRDGASYWRKAEKQGFEKVLKRRLGDGLYKD